MTEIPAKLRRIAREIEETAIGSSRIAMYKVLSDELRQTATEMEERLRVSQMEAASKP